MMIRVSLFSLALFGDKSGLRFSVRGFGYALFYFRVIKMDLSQLAVNEKIKFLRKQKNYNQEQMGKFFGIKTSTYSQKERKKHRPCVMSRRVLIYILKSERLRIIGIT